MTKNDILNLQTYKMFSGDTELYVSRDDVLKLIDNDEIPYTETEKMIFKVAKMYENELHKLMTEKEYIHFTKWVTSELLKGD